MPERESDAERRSAFTQGLLPAKHAAKRKLPDKGKIGAHMVELGALARIADGGQTTQDELAAEALAAKRFARGCAVADSDSGACPGWCVMAIAGSEGWVTVS